jgi:very-short-patch-repair endonuclease
VVEFILQHAEQHPEQSLGVITLGVKHAMRIEAGLHRVRMTRPDLDDFFAESAQERFFVKNLERVQGDERDVIVLSIGVGNKLDGRVDYRGFGPLNGEQGKRRLNVAITRARRRMAVVSSFSHHDMDPSRSGRDTGTTMLRDYLQYAACGGASLGDGVATAVAENPFESSIASALRSAGIPLIPQWGVSGYRIDLAATHPQRPGQFVLAIECDGASYHSLPTARDRDRLRQQHLEALGWSFHRIWSTDWFTRRDDEIRRAVAAYEAAVARADRGDGPVVGHSVDVASQQTPAFDSPRPRPTCPRFTPKLPIDTYSDALLHSLVVWIKSDEQLRTNDQLVDELVGLLGYQRRGPRIVERLDGIVERSNMSARAAA